MGAAKVTRNRDNVTCKRCRKYMIQGGLALEPVRGRPMEVTCSDGQTERGQLIDAAAAGLELCRHHDGKRILVRWPRVKRAAFVDEVSQ